MFRLSLNDALQTGDREPLPYHWQNNQKAEAMKRGPEDLLLGSRLDHCSVDMQRGSTLCTNKPCALHSFNLASHVSLCNINLNIYFNLLSLLRAGGGGSG